MASPTNAGKPNSVGRIGWIAAAVLGTAYVVCIVQLKSFPMQDYANHVARAGVMADILFHHGARFGEYFQLHLTPVPYVLPDLILASMVEVFGVPIGAGIFTALVILSLPCALVFYAYSCNVAARAWPFLFLLGLYLTTDWFFIVGFLAFRLAISLIVVNLALAEILRRRWNLPMYAVYVAALAVGFLTHLAVLVFTGAALGVSAVVRLWFRTTTLRREIYVLLPLAALFAAYSTVFAAAHAAGASLVHNWAAPGGSSPLVSKIRNLRYDFIGFDRRVPAVTTILFFVCILWPVRRELMRPSAAWKPAVAEQLALAATFLGIYFVLPYESEYTLYVDIRALPMVTLSLVFACLRMPSEGASGKAFGDPRMLGLAAVLAAAGLVYTAVPLKVNNAWINEFRRIVSVIPAGARVLPVHTETKRPYLIHVAVHAVLDRGALDPYLFSGNYGDPMTYFRYRSLPYAPHFQWYRAQEQGLKQDSEVDWNRVACSYDYILVTMPYDAAFIRVPVTEVASNDTAALLAVDRQACRQAANSQ
jgi:hypothetical protein